MTPEEAAQRWAWENAEEYQRARDIALMAGYRATPLDVKSWVEEIEESDRRGQRMMEHIWVDRVEHEQLKLDHYAMQDRINADEKKIEKLREEKAYWMDVAANRQWQIGDLKACISDEIERLEQENDDLYDDLRDEIQALSDKTEELGQENETLKKRAGLEAVSANRLEHEREDLYAKIDGRNGLIETLKANLTEAEGRIHRLECEVDDRNERLGRLGDALSYWKAEYREAKGWE